MLFRSFEGDITINREWIEYHIRKCDTVLPLVAIATPATYVKQPLKVFELDFEANLPIVRSSVKHKSVDEIEPPLLPHLGAFLQRPILRRIFAADLRRLRLLLESERD